MHIHKFDLLFLNKPNGHPLFNGFITLPLGCSLMMYLVKILLGKTLWGEGKIVQISLDPHYLLSH